MQHFRRYPAAIRTGRGRVGLDPTKMIAA